MVNVTLERVPGRPLAVLTVEDDAPLGFADLTHAFTMFAESKKKVDPEKRGRFNLGEKLVLALCEEARICSTTGTVIFGPGGRSRSPKKRERGSEFRGTLRMNRGEYEEACEAVRSAIVPEGIETTFNEQILPTRLPIHSFEVSLPTEIADTEGLLRRTMRKALVRVYEPTAGEVPSLYEMGIPVVETGDKWHIDIGQKVPLNMDRDNVTPAYLRTIRTVVLNEMHHRISAEDANDGWVREATADARCSDEAVRTAVVHRFGTKRVSYDPSDPEANKRAVSAGYTVVSGSQLSKQEWANVKRAEAMLPAGQVTPSPKPFSNDPNAPPCRMVREDQWTEGMKQIAAYAQMLAKELMKVDIKVRIADDTGMKASAAYGQCHLVFNLAYLGRRWFEHGADHRVDSLLIHEFGHQYSGDHLSSEYYKALCTLGAKLKALAIQRSELFSPFVPENRILGNEPGGLQGFKATA